MKSKKSKMYCTVNNVRDYDKEGDEQKNLKQFEIIIKCR